MNTLDELTRDPVDEAMLSRHWRVIQRRRADAPGRRALRYGAVGALVVAACVSMVFAISGDEPGPLRLADGAAFAEIGVGETVLDDGSRIALGEGGSLEVLESSAARVVLRLARGRARFSVTPSGPRRWIVEVGARVEVVGTVFTVERAGGRVDVGVERGVVLVFHEDLPDGVQRLSGGQRVEVGARVTVTEAIEADPIDAQAIERVGAVVEPASEPVLALEPEPEPVARPRGGSVRPSVDDAPTAAELLERADIARAHGEPAQAVRWLERILERHPNDASVSMAAVTVGRLELRRLGHPARALVAFDRALEAGLPASIAEDVYASRVEALRRSGRDADARAAAAEYHRRYPSGRWTVEVDRWTP